jgi:hypothetical protein
MSDKQTKDLIAQWAKRDGQHVVKAKLIERRLSSSLVDKLIGQRYSGQIRGANLSLIEDELRKAGMLQDEAG